MLAFNRGEEVEPAKEAQMFSELGGNQVVLKPREQCVSRRSIRSKTRVTLGLGKVKTTVTLARSVAEDWRGCSRRWTVSSQRPQSSGLSATKREAKESRYQRPDLHTEAELCV